MSYTIKLAKGVEKVLKKWKKSNPMLFSKAQSVILEIADHPRTGIGHPEALKGGNDVTYSRRITASDRIIYDIYDDRIEVIVLEIEGHYNDK